jgi:hypothetical protein
LQLVAKTPFVFPGDAREPPVTSSVSDRLLLSIYTSMLEVLRRPIEFTQYASTEFRCELEKNRFRQSMSRKGNF